MNYALYRIAKDRSEAERIADKIYSGEIDEVGFRKRTRSPSIRMSPIFTAGRSGAASCTLESGTRDLEIPQPVRRMCCGILHSNRAILIPNSLSYAVPTVSATHSLRIRLFPFLSASLTAGSQAACLFCEIDCRLPALSRTGWLAENLPPRTKRRVYFPHLPGPAVNPAGRKNNRPSVQDYRRGKEKFKSL